MNAEVGAGWLCLALPLLILMFCYTAIAYIERSDAARWRRISSIDAREEETPWCLVRVLLMGVHEDKHREWLSRGRPGLRRGRDIEAGVGNCDHDRDLDIDRGPWERGVGNLDINRVGPLCF